jgi:hypothetical protein
VALTTSNRPATLVGSAGALVVAVLLVSRLGAYSYPVEHGITRELAPEPAE